MSEKKTIIRFLQRRDYQTGIIDFETLVEEAANKVFGISSIGVSSFIEAKKTRFWNVLLQEIDNVRQRGLKPYFKIEDNFSKKVSYNYEDIRLKSRPAIIREIDNLSDRRYEMLACILCRLLGAKPSNIRLTPPGNEGGIDFIATINFPPKSHYFIGNKGPIRIIGQCKKYSTAIQNEKIKQFITTLNQVKHRSHLIEQHIPSWFRASQGPILGWVISHNGFQSGADTLAKDFGIILSDTREVGEMISLSNKFFWYETPIARARRLWEEVNTIENDELYN